MFWVEDECFGLKMSVFSWRWVFWEGERRVVEVGCLRGKEGRS